MIFSDPASFPSRSENVTAEQQKADLCLQLRREMTLPGRKPLQLNDTIQRYHLKCRPAGTT